MSLPASHFWIGVGVICSSVNSATDNTLSAILWIVFAIGILIVDLIDHRGANNGPHD